MAAHVGPFFRSPSPRIPALSLFTLSLALASCSSTHVLREVRAIWAPDDSSVLVVRSEYDTWDPSSPYYSDPKASNYQVVLLEAPPPSPGTAPLQGAVEVARFEEKAWSEDLGKAIPLSAGGLAQYNPVWWFPGRRLAVFSGGNTGPFAWDLAASGPIWYRKPLDLVRGAYAAAYPAESASRLDFLASSSDPRSAVASPDGSLVAALYGLFEIPAGGSVFDDFDYSSVVVLFDSASGAPLDARVPLADRRYDARAVDGYAPLSTEAQNYCNLAWSPGGTSIYVYLYQLSGVTGEYRRIRELPLRADLRGFTEPLDAAAVPARPLANPSGPLSRGGVALRLLLSGNATTLSALAFAPGALPAWRAFADDPLVPVADFLAYSQAFNF